MGKTKTAFVSEEPKKGSKSSEEAYKEKKERQAAKVKEEKVHIAGLKGGQRIKTIEVELPPTEISIEEPRSAEASRGLREPKVRSKKYQEAKAKIDKTKLYPISDAIKLVKETSYSKFDGTVELHLVLKKAGTSVNVTLPNPFGREKKIEVASEETLKKIQGGKIDFDILLATADIMPKLVPFARILGPKGLMPNPKNGTLIKSEKDAAKFSGNTLALKTEKDAPLIHTAIGKVSQKPAELEENAKAIFEALGGTKQVVRAFAKATMGPSIKVELSS